MKDWKVKQYMYHQLNSDYSDDLNKVETVYNEDTVIEDAVRHFYEKVDQWLYPAKSYFVAICYAYWLSEDYDEDFMECLNDKDLLYGNDPYYKTYDESPDIYNSILDQIELLPNTGMVPDVREYYELECGIK
jgi:hypothetical protein